MAINLMLADCSWCGTSLANRLVYDDKKVDFCYHASYQGDPLNIARPRDGRVEYLPWGVGEYADYDKICDMDALPSLSRDIMEKMSMYEAMAIKLGRRIQNFPVAEYEEVKRRYHRSLRFWNYIIDSREINVVYADEGVHHQYVYVIYALARIKEIPILMKGYATIPGLCVFSKDGISGYGYDIQKCYEEIGANDIELHGRVRDYYEEYTRPIETIIKSSASQANRQRDQRMVFKGSYSQYEPPIYYPKRLVRTVLSAVLKRRNLEWIRYNKNRLLQNKIAAKRIAIYKKDLATHIDRYGGMVDKPDYSKQYIYFALQQDPEETTAPRAGVFAEQYTSIWIIARAAAKLGMYVYVKEHFVQKYRETEVYDMICSIKNVKLIKSTVSSFDLIEHCIATATQTGSCIHEGILQGKPSLVVGDGYFWKGMPGVFEVNDEYEAYKALTTINNGFIIDRNQVKKYFYAIEQCAEDIPQIYTDDEESFVKIVRRITEFIDERVRVDAI